MKRDATEQVFCSQALRDEDVVLSSDVLMLNDLRGVETHGVSNAPMSPDTRPVV